MSVKIDLKSYLESGFWNENESDFGIEKKSSNGTGREL
jgi:hypothetical protein